MLRDAIYLKFGGSLHSFGLLSRRLALLHESQVDGFEDLVVLYQLFVLRQLYHLLSAFLLLFTLFLHLFEVDSNVRPLC